MLKTMTGMTSFLTPLVTSGVIKKNNGDKWWDRQWENGDAIMAFEPSPLMTPSFNAHNPFQSSSLLIKLNIFCLKVSRLCCTRGPLGRGWSDRRGPSRSWTRITGLVISPTGLKKRPKFCAIWSIQILLVRGSLPFRRKVCGIFSWS